MEKVKQEHFTIDEAGTWFIILAVVFLTLGAYVQTRELISGLLITEFGIVALPTFIYAILKGKNIKAVYRFKKIPSSAIIKLLGIAALMIPVVAVANLITLFFIELLGTSIPSSVPTASTSFEYILLFAVIAGSAGLCEELFFRGVILNAYEHALGRKWGAIFSGLLFGIFHFNPQNLFGPILLGILFAYLVQVTGSIWAGVIAHTANNGIAVTAGYLINIASPTTSVETDMAFSSPATIVGVAIFYLVLAGLCFMGLKTLLKQIDRQFQPKPMPYDFSSRNLSAESTDVMSDEVSDVEMLAETKCVSVYEEYRTKQKIKLTPRLLSPIYVSLILYALIIYVAYFKS